MGSWFANHDLYDIAATQPAGWPWPRDATPHTCPICQGRGMVRPGFYEGGGLAGRVRPLDGRETRCRSCEGRGVLWGDG